MRKLFQLVGEISVTGLEALNTKMKTFDSDTQKAMKQIDKLGKSISKVGIELSKNLTVPLMAFGVAAFKGVQAASDLNETISNSGELFGSSNKDILAWSETAAKGFGQSKQQAIDAAAIFAIFGRSAGRSGGDLVQFSTKFTELASDLASFNNTSPEEAITAIGAAMRGEMEPIRKYGVLLDDMSMTNTA